MTDDQPRSPLAGLRYGQRALDLSRFVDDPTDDAIATVVRAANVQSTDERDALRTSLDGDDCYSLLTFARRRSAAAIRDGSLMAAQEAIQALTLVTLSKIDFRDLSVDFPVYALGRLGSGPGRSGLVRCGGERTGHSTSFAAMAVRAARQTLKDCALIEVVSRHGLGFMETWATPYAPQSDLTGIAVRMADQIDAAGRYESMTSISLITPRMSCSRDSRPTAARSQ